MLYADARCDRPFFWWSLPLAVGLANAGAVAHLKARHAAGDCFTRRAAGRAYLGMAVPVNMLLALLLAWRSGILSDIAPPIAATPASATALVLVVALLFALASHALTSLVLPWLTLASAANLRSR
ncbi:hypothetical protein CEJ42_05370 [Herbaspirillum robiniae]|uniref:Uncharacterized protein n=2 Tax=Herbaspirillum robiniae TaxID=2014887 RepID=A0A246WTR4_9BURK|nr:hypothetical protein CEJ42_05370 [Herbaspirillum robiniae]